MKYSNMLTIQDGSKETFFGILIILSFLLVMNAFGASYIHVKKKGKIRELKKIAEQQLRKKELLHRKEER